MKQDQKLYQILNNKELTSLMSVPSNVDHYAGILSMLNQSSKLIEKSKKVRIIKELLSIDLMKKIDEKLMINNIKLIFLKGLAMAHRYYSDSCLRGFSDIDLYCSYEYFESVESIFQSLGGVKEINSYKWIGNDFKSVWLFKGIHIELHSSLLFDRKLKGDIYTRTRKLSFGDFNCILELDAQLNFVYLCGHNAFQHLFDEFYWLLDFYFILKNDDLNWTQVILDAKELKLTRSVIATLHLIDHIFKTTYKKKLEDYQLPSQNIFNFLLKLYVTPKRCLMNSHREASYYYLFLKALFRPSLSEIMWYGLQRTRQRILA